jgi:transcriptional regulator of met regulon
MSYYPKITEFIKANPNQFTYLELKAKFGHTLRLLHKIAFKNKVYKLINKYNTFKRQRTTEYFIERCDYESVKMQIVEDFKTSKFNINGLKVKYGLNYSQISKIVNEFDLQSYSKTNADKQLYLSIIDDLKKNPQKYSINDIAKKYEVKKGYLRTQLLKLNALKYMISNTNQKNNLHQKQLENIKYTTNIELILEARKLGITQQSIATKLGLTKQRVWQIELNHTKKVKS